MRIYLLKGESYLKKERHELKIENIEIVELYNLYDYNIKFNEDITFLHGKNGCGKTTILNIITYIITGRIYKLFSYEFKSIILTYKYDNENEKIIFNKKEDNIEVLFKKEKVVIEKINSIEDNELMRIERKYRYSSEVEEAYFNKYPILETIKDLFDFVYIPLNRNDLADRERIPLYRRYRYRRLIKENSGEPIYNVANIILENYAKIKSEISGLGKVLQTDIVKAMYQYNISDYESGIKLNKNAINKDIDNFKKANLYDDELGELIQSFYKKLIKSDDKKNQDDKELLEFVFNVSKVAQLNKINNVFNKYDEKVKELNEPITKLETIVNRFFEDSAEKKKLMIKEDDIFFMTEHDNRRVEINDLSSGEKQILILFTYLVFDVATKQNPIFIIDEPELSLHLLWQKNFVNSVLETNPKMQLILATHSPEIIANYRDKTYKVELDMK